MTKKGVTEWHRLMRRAGAGRQRGNGKRCFILGECSDRHLYKVCFGPESVAVGQAERLY